jgi:F0F1-type ATP synthase delta subunit
MPREILIKSSAALTGVQQKKIITAATVKYGNDISVRFAVEPELIGGITIYDNGRVTDNTLQRKLKDVSNLLRENI